MRVPKRIINQMKHQVGLQRRRVERETKQLAELEAILQQMEPMESKSRRRVKAQPQPTAEAAE